MSSNPANSTAFTLAVGDKLDKFEIVQQIGAGGMSIVWKAYDRLLDRFVAIKQLAPDGGGRFSDDVREQFQREAQLQKRVASGHQHLVQIIDVVDDERGLFIIMEFVEGASLEQLLAQRKTALDQRQALGIIAATAIALETIHKHNVIHRDLKPSNILLTQDGGLKVCDFGLAAILAEQDAMAAGTVRYMAPEMFTQSEVDGRADIYALGMVAYEMFAGRERFEQAFRLVLRDQRNQAMRWMKWHTNPRAAAQPLNQLSDDIPEPVSDLVARMMDKDRDRRVSSASELLEAIRRVFTGEAATHAQEIDQAASQPVGSEEATAALPKKSKLPLILAASLIIMLTIFGVIVGMRQSEEAAAKKAVYAAAEQRFGEAKQQLADKQYYPAYTTFRTLAAEWSGTGADRLAGASLYMATFAAGQVEREAGNLATAYAQFEAAEQMVKDNPQLEQALKQQVVSDIREKTDQRITGMAKVAEIRELMSQGVEDRRKLNAALDEINRVLAERSREPAFLDEHYQQIEALKQEWEDNFAEGRTKEILADAQRQLDLGNLDEASRALDHALGSMGQDPRIERMRRTIAVNQEFIEYMSTADQSERRNDPAGAIDALKLAMANVKDERLKYTGAPLPTERELGERIDRLRARILFDEGRRAESQGDKRTAISKYQAAAGLGHDAAKAKLDQFAVDRQYDQLVNDGRTHMRRGQYAEAIKALQQAQAIQQDQRVEEMIKRCRVGILMGEAQQILGNAPIKPEDVLEPARAKFQKVLAIDDRHIQAERYIAEIDSWQRYYDFMKEGEEAMAAEKYGPARIAFDNARREHNTPTAEARLQDANYRSWFTKAEALYQTRRYPSALGAINQALRFKAEDQAAQELKARIEARMPRQGETDEE